MTARCPITPLARPLSNSSPALPDNPNYISPNLTSSTFHQPKDQQDSTDQPYQSHNRQQLFSSGCNNENCDQTNKINRLLVIMGQSQVMLADLNAEVKAIKDKISQHFQNARGLQEDLQDFEILGKIPVQTLEEMEELEKALENVQFKKQLCKVLTSVGGNDPKTMIYNCLRRLMSYHVAVSYSYSGITARNKEKTKKLAFAKTSMCRVAHDAVMKVHRTTEDVIKNWMSKWLQQAKYRQGQKCSEAGEDATGGDVIGDMGET